jgi:hypothetical protein
VACGPLEQRPLSSLIPVVSRPATGGIELGQKMLCAFAVWLPASANVRPEAAITNGNAADDRNFFKTPSPPNHFERYL